MGKIEELEQRVHELEIIIKAHIDRHETFIDRSPNIKNIRDNINILDKRTNKSNFEQGFVCTLTNNKRI